MNHEKSLSQQMDSELGQTHRVYRYRDTMCLIVLVLQGLVFGALGIVVLAATAAMVAAEGYKDGHQIAVSIGLGVMIFGLATLFYSWKISRSHVIAMENGILFASPFRTRSWRWNMISEIQVSTRIVTAFGATVREANTYRFVTAKGSNFKLVDADFPGIDELVQFAQFKMAGPDSVPTHHGDLHPEPSPSEV